MKQICSITWKQFEITDADIEFYKSMWVPSPTLCPEERQKRRLAWRNERKLYKRECNATGKQIISIYKPGTQYKVYDSGAWWSDSWDAMEYGRDFDFDQTFFQQYNILFTEVPKIALIAANNENSNYVNLETDSKNCYMNTGGHFNQDCMYSTHVFYWEDCLDSYWLDHSKHCYESFKLFNCYKLFYSYWCYDSQNSYYCSFSRNLEHCFGCVHLENKKFHILNTEYSPEAYEEKIQQILANKQKLKNFLSELEELRSEHASKNNTIQNSENVSWEDIKDSKNAHEVYGLVDGEDVKYIYVWMGIKDSYDCTRLGFQISRCYEIMAGTNLDNVLFSCYVLDGVSDTYYSTNCHSSHHLFGCTWLRNKSYCILNKQYTKEEYEELVPKIIEKMKQDWEWWEFFPSSMSPFGYNETVANEYFPLTKEQAIKKWFNWSDYEAPFPKVEKIIPANKLPENISDIPDDILNWAIECEVTKKPFRIIKPELEFYRKHNLPIPKRHPDQRNNRRILFLKSKK